MNYFEIRRQLKKKKDNFLTFQSDEMVNVLLSKSLYGFF